MESWVTLPLLAVSFVAVVLIFERLWFWQRLARKQRSLVRSVLDDYGRSPQKAVLRLKQNADLPVARIFLAALSLQDATPDEFNLALESAAQGELPLLQRFQTILTTIVGISPLLGLLGTILGLMRALSSFEFGGAGGDGALEATAGIDEALVSTALGLTVAIFTLVFANAFHGLYRKQKSFLLEAGGQLELLHRQRYRKGMEFSSGR